MAGKGNEPEAEFVQRFLAGDPDTIETVRGAIEKVVRHSGYAIPTADRSDIAQEVMLDACRSLAQPGFALRKPIEALLRTFAHRRCIDWLRRRRASGPVGDGTPDVAPGPDGALLENERQRLATWIMENLSSPCRELIALHVEQGLPYSDIAARTGRSEGALRVEMCKCLKDARRLLDEIRAQRSPGPGRRSDSR